MYKRQSRRSLLYETVPLIVVWQASLIFSGKESLSDSFFSASDLVEQFSNPSVISTLQVEHFPVPPQALKCDILFLIDAVSIVSFTPTSIFFLSGCTSAEKRSPSLRLFSGLL